MKKILSALIGIVCISLSISVTADFSINSWVYQLQNTDYNQLLSESYDLAVIDFQDSELSKQQIQSLQNQGKKVVSYLSIGEAEDYRNYWKEEWDKNPPSFLDEENPDWPGNYKVKYWNGYWKMIIMHQVDKIKSLGYDGVYLDIIDAYEYYEQKGREGARIEMMDFVRQIAKRGRMKNEGFLVIPQNSPELLVPKEVSEYSAKLSDKEKEELKITKRYLSYIDGVGKEDTWYNDNISNNEESIYWELKYLNLALSQGKFVLTIDYPTSLSLQCDFIQKSREQRFVPFVSNRDLDTIPYVDCN